MKLIATHSEWVALYKVKHWFDYKRNITMCKWKSDVWESCHRFAFTKITIRSPCSARDRSSVLVSKEKQRAHAARDSRQYISLCAAFQLPKCVRCRANYGGVANQALPCSLYSAIRALRRNKISIPVCYRRFSPERDVHSTFERVGMTE